MNEPSENYFEKENANASDNPGDDAPKKAGSPITDPFDAAMRTAVQPNAAFSGEDRPAKTSRYAPVGTLEFLGIFLLLLIPVVNLVLLAVWSLGGCRKVNKRNFSRAYLIMLALFIALGFWGFTVLRGLYRDIFVTGNLSADSPAAGVVEFFGKKAAGALINQAARNAADQSGASLNSADQTTDLSVIAALALAQDREGLRNLGFSEDAIEGLIAAAKDPSLLARYLSKATKP